MVNLSVFYMAVVLLWQFRLPVAPLSLSPSCETHKKTLRKKLQASIFFLVSRLGRWSNRNSVLCEAKARVAVLALFYKSVNRQTKTKEIEKKQQTTNPSKLMQFAPRIYGSLCLCLILVYSLHQWSDVEFVQPVDK